MKTNMLVRNCFGIFLAVATCTAVAWEAKAAQDTGALSVLEKERLAIAEAFNHQFAGWINVIAENYLVIDAKQFAITKDTVFLVDKGALPSAPFVIFRADAERNLLEVDTAEPTEYDLERKPEEGPINIDFSQREPISSRPKKVDNLRFEDGKWVN